MRPIPAALCLLALLLSACEGHPQPDAGDQAARDVEPAVTHQPPMALDGQFKDWPLDNAFMTDTRHVYVRLRLPQPVTLQAATHTYALQFDIDGDAETGRSEQTAAERMGIDLEIHFSPFVARRGQTPQRGQATRAIRIGPAGETTPVGHAELGLMFAPTHSSDQFEIRLDRAALEKLRTDIPHTHPAAARFVKLDASGTPVATSAHPPFELSLAFGHSLQLTQILPFPTPTPDELRIVTLNVEYASTMKNAEPFGRFLRALDPDIVLIQEWDKGDRHEIADWFNRHVPSDSGWHAIRSAGWGVAIASRHPLERLGPELLTRPEDAPPDTHIPDRAIRFVGALVETPIGPVAAASVHLKCCGYDGSAEDLARIAEAQLINDTLEAALAERAAAGEPLPLRILGGDINLVGSPEPLEHIAAGLDIDGSPMQHADAWVIGDRSQYTWTDGNSSFTPGRLDYVLVSDAALEISRTFILDTARLPDDVLAFHKLERTDSAATDHRPIVVDVRRK